MSEGPRIWSKRQSRRNRITGDVAALLASDKVAVIAAYGTGKRVSHSTRVLVGELERGGYRTIVSRASKSPTEFVWPWKAGAPTVLLARPNLGYDFGSWAAALHSFPELLRKPRLLFLNDSLVGPFASIDGLLEDFDTRDCDGWGAVMNPQFFPHFQSFFFGFRDGIGDSAQIREFWRRVRHLGDKQAVIDRYELGINRALFSEGFVVDSPNGVGSTGYGLINPTLHHWRELMQRGFPFVKRALIAKSESPAKVAEVKHDLERRYGVRVQDWL